MNSEQSGCALPGPTVDWHSIDWSECHQRVRRLQARIVKATQEGRWGKVKALQWLLTHSFSGKAIAVKRVTENKGKKTPGVDGQTWPTPEAKSQAILSLKRHGYKALPLKRVNIPKSNGKIRPLGIPTMKDRAMQKLHLLALEPVSETKADGNSYGFRPERSTADACKQCYLVLEKPYAAQWILEGDIKGCFDNINHQWLLDHIPMDQVMLRKWLKAGYVYGRELFPTEAGTPQGGIISPTLANMALDGLEPEIRAKFGQKRSVQARKNQINLVRYADDFIITARTKELLENEVKPLVVEFLKKRGLTLSEEKTRITHIYDGFDFLGWNIRKYVRRDAAKLHTRPSKKNVQAFLDDIRGTVKANPTAKQANLIALLNPKVRGWANYHRGAVAKRTFAKVDHEIWKVLWQWAKRRHPNKHSRWVKDKYFKHIGTRNWVFAEEIRTKEGEARMVRLVLASDTKIVRHVKVKSDANPFDPAQENYFEERLGVKMNGGSVPGRIKWLRLWWRQEKECPICHQLITEETGWNIHHVIPKSDGGGDNSSNLVLLHPNCHRQLHAKYQR